jgi:cytochrome c-type biogenesis protein
MAFASGWSPCVGLGLSSILLLASSSDTLSQGIFLLGAYSLGMAIPFLIPIQHF